MTMMSPILEGGVVMLMALWLILSVVFALPLRQARRRLNRFNHGLWFANWAVFGSGRDRAEICIYALAYRDDCGGGEVAWVEVIRGRPWAWHAWLWQPGRRVADRIHRIGQDVAQVKKQGGRAESWLREQEAIIARYLAMNYAKPAGARREIRLSVRRSVIGAASGHVPGVGAEACYEEHDLLRYVTYDA